MTESNHVSADEQFSEEETKRRADAALKRMLQTPHKPHKDSKKARPTP